MIRFASESVSSTFFVETLSPKRQCQLIDHKDVVSDTNAEYLCDPQDRDVPKVIWIF